MRRAILTVNYIDKRTGCETHIPVTYFKKPANEAEYKKFESVLDSLLDQIRDDEHHPLAMLLQIIGDNLEEYDNRHFPPIGAGLSESEKVKYLMELQHLKQKDLADIFGGQANVSKFLMGERSLSKRQIAELKKRFKISADYFI